MKKSKERREQSKTVNRPQHWCHLEVFADYFQFYVKDALNTHIPEIWTEEDVENRAKVGDGVVVICPVRNMTVPVDVEIWEAAPNIERDAWQHIVEAPLVTSGVIVIDECTGEPHAHFTVQPGEYTVRALFQGLDTLTEDGLDGDDHYGLQIWRSPCSALCVLKRWHE